MLRGPGHIVLNGDQAPPKGAQPPILGPYLLWSNGWMDQDATWYGGSARPRPYCKMGTQLHRPERGTAPLPPIFGPSLLWSNGWMDQDALGTEVGLSPDHIMLDGDPKTQLRKGHNNPSHFGRCIVDRRLDRSGYHLVRRQASAQITLC